MVSPGCMGASLGCERAVVTRWASLRGCRGPRRRRGRRRPAPLGAQRRSTTDGSRHEAAGTIPLVHLEDRGAGSAVRLWWLVSIAGDHVNGRPGPASVVVVHGGHDRAVTQRPRDDRLDTLPLPTGKATTDAGDMHRGSETVGMVGDNTQASLEGVIANRGS